MGVGGEERMQQEAHGECFRGSEDRGYTSKRKLVAKQESGGDEDQDALEGRGREVNTGERH